jgi:hypothetical protein
MHELTTTFDSDAIIPEAQILVACVEDHSPAGGDAIEAAIARGVDWERLTRLAQWHAMAPLAYRALSRCAATVPAAALAHLRERFRSNSARNLYLAHELVRITRLLENQGLPTMSFKGPALASALYGDLAMRDFADLDILVRPPDVPRIRAALVAEGYRPRFLDGKALESGFFQCSEEAFGARDGIAVIDAHWRIVPRYFDFADAGASVWDRAQTMPLLSGSIVTLAPADLLLFLCIHGTKHGWPLLGWICDLAMLIRREPSLDWPWMLEEADRLRSRRPLLLGTYLANAIFGAPADEPLLARARGDRVVMRLATAIMRRLFSGVARSELFHEWYVPLTALESARQKIRYLADRALTPTIEDWELIRLPRRLFPLYYAIRPLRLAITQGPRLAQSIMKFRDIQRVGSVSMHG